MSSSRVLAPCLALWLLAVPAPAFTPALNLVTPCGGQRGTEQELHLHGSRLENPQQVLFLRPGIEVLALEAKAADHAVARIRIAPDAPLGEHPLRLRTAGGISYLRTFWVGQFPSVDESEPNNSFDQPQRVEPNSTVHGIAASEDEDYYVCSMKKGDRLSVEVEAMRLGRVMFDSHVAILDPRRFELAACDDSPLLRTDSFASVVVPEDGDYRVVVREAAYEGSDACAYRLHIGTFPRPSAVFPGGAKPGEAVEFLFTGDPAGPIRQSFTIPPDAGGIFPLFPVHGNLAAPSPLWIRVSPVDHAAENEPNNSPAQATPLPSLPAAAHGVLQAAGDSDYFRFTAAKGENLTLRVLARALRSPVDSVLTLRDAKGKQLAGNDDQGGPDSTLAWACPADGEYRVGIRDQLGRGGQDFTYRIEIARREPALTASLPVVERNDSQKRRMLCVPRGNRCATVVNVTRENIACDLALEAESLPAGITLHAPPVARSLNNFPVVLEAAPDAPLAGAFHRFFIKSAGDAPALRGPLLEKISLVEVNNQGSYHDTESDRIAVAVIDEAPFRIELDPPAVPLVKNGILPLKIRCLRKQGYEETVTARFLWNPPGISGPVSVPIPAGRNEAVYELNCAADAPDGTWQVAMLAEANTPQGPVLVSSALVALQVVDPYLALSIEMAATEQGKPVPILCKIDVRHGFAGDATAELLGLPHGVKAPPVSFSKDQAEITFPLEIAPDATVGKHPNLFCKVTVTENNAPLIHQTGHGGTLRIDKPAAPAKPATNAPPKPAAPTAAQPSAAPKPLSRLEQLRQQKTKDP